MTRYDCPQCGSGKLKFDRVFRLWSCNGLMDPEDDRKELEVCDFSAEDLPEVGQQFHYVQELIGAQWRRSALGHYWAKRADAESQLKDLRRRYPDRRYRLSKNTGEKQT